MKTNLSSVIAGTMNWGTWDKNLSAAEMTNLIHVCLENQISTFDLADIYGGYTTEATFGEGFKKSQIDRSKIQLITKCGIQLHNEKRKNRIKHYDYSKEYILWSVENSLKHLETDFVDVFLLHRPSPLMVADEIAEAVEQLKKEGKILSFGLSNFSTSQTDLIHQKTNVSFNQIQFSATNYEPMLDGTLDHMEIHQIIPMAWNPLGTVFREDTEQTRRLKKLFARLVKKYEVGADILLLTWLMQHPAKVIPVAGTVNVGRIQQLKKAKEIKMDKEEWFEIWTESMGNEVP